MRKLILAVSIATIAAFPAVAQSTPQERRAERDKARAERQEAREDRREQASERHVEARDREPAAHQPDRPTRVTIQQPGAVQRERPNVDQRRAESDSVANWRQEQRDEFRQSRQDRVADWTSRPRVTPPANARPDVPAPLARGASRSSGIQWSSGWHRDRRHDWRDYRRRHGSLFRLGFYFDPFGWSYQRYGRGWRLWPSYYHRSYWLGDPMMYRLPYAPPPYRWIRYWDDALLVDIYTGEVVDVVHDFFW